MVLVPEQPSYADVTTDAAATLCNCPFCQALASKGGAAALLATAHASATDNARGAELLPQVANGDGTVSYSGDRNIDALLIGSRWTGTNLTYTFPTDGNYASADPGSGQVPFNAAQQQAARAAFNMVQSVTNLVITEVSPDKADTATFRLSSTVSSSVASAMGSFPGYVGGEGGDIWFGRTSQPYYESPAKGNWGYSTIFHEIGHTLGLKHGHSDYSDVDISSLFEGATSPMYGTQALEYDKDGQAWSLMSYTGGPNGVTAFEGEGVNQPQTYMQYDIAALQFLYGANYSTQSGNTVYRWNEKTGEGYVNGVGQGRPAGNVVFQTIWDGGGNDTYDLSNYNGGITVDLRPGAFSTFSVAQLADNNAYTGGPLPAPGNVANALLYQGDVRSLIENAIGGAGNDTLIGNQVANRLVGNDGDDVLAGGAGNDTLNGGAGNDIADFTGATSGIAVTINSAASAVYVVNGTDVDKLIGIEGVIGTAFDDKLAGDAGANTLSGGAGGRDVLNGGGGDDTLIGGGYTLAYRDEADIIRDANATNRSLATAIALDGSFELAYRETESSAVIYPGSKLPHATVVAAAAGTEGVDYYSFTAQAGSRALFDIDATNNYTGIEILDAQGNIIASNYQEITTDDGSRLGYDARLAYTFATSGTFYVRVTGATFSETPRNLQADQPYTLHVSLENATVAAPVIRQTASAVINGGSGNDTMIATAGSDKIDGGSGRDTVSYENHFTGVTVSLATQVAQQTGAGLDTIVNVENLTGSHYADTLSGDAGANVIDGDGGNDVLDGAGGVDTLSFASQSAGVTASLAAQGTTQSYQLGRTVLATNFENLTGGSGDDVLTGDKYANTINGGAGNDVLSVNAGGKFGARDTLNGGTGTDTASFAAFSAAIVAKLNDNGDGWVKSNLTIVADLHGIENLVGGRGADTLTGNAGANSLVGGAGADTLNGGAGDDRLDGGTGNDIINGGAGTDTVVFTGGGNIKVDLANTGVQSTGQGQDRLINIENVETGSGNDVVRGDAGNNLFVDGGGNDVYVGRNGFDTVSFAAAKQNVSIDLSLTTAQDSGALGTKQLSGIEGLVGGEGRNFFIGSAEDNSLIGGSDGDLLVGGLGRDTIIGGGGADVLVGDSVGVADAVTGDAAGDYLSGGDGDDLVFGGAGDDTVLGGAGDDTLSNGSFNSTITLTSDGPFFDRGTLIAADGGNDTIDGGAGLDFAILAYNGRKEGVFVDVRDPGKTTTILSGGVAVGTITGIEQLGFEGGDGNDVVYGGAGNDFIATYGGNDIVNAGAGDDTVYAGSGKDRFNGGDGYDVLSFSDATGNVVFDLERTDEQNTGGGGRVKATGFEAVTGSSYSDTLYLTDRADNILDSSGGDDSFYGRGGDDKLMFYRFSPGASTLLLDGGDGNDDLSLLSFQPGQTITMNGGAGDDVMVIVGAESAVIDAGADDDYVSFSIGNTYGVLGGFTMTLGAGADRFSFDIDEQTLTGDHTDTIITDFSVADDVLMMNRIPVVRYSLTDGSAYRLLTNYTVGDDPFATGHYILKQDGTSTILQIDQDGAAGPGVAVSILTLLNVDASTLTAANFSLKPTDSTSVLNGDPSWSFVAATNGTDAADVLAGTGDRDRLFGLAGDDTLQGGAGDDVLVGGAGKDRLDGGAGHDLLYGGDDNDTFLFASAADADGDGIRDFRTGDQIDLARLFTGTFAWIGSDAFDHHAGQLQVVQNADGLYVVAGDVDGDGVADFQFTVQSDHALVAADILL